MLGPHHSTSDCACAAIQILLASSSASPENLPQDNFNWEVVLIGQSCMRTVGRQCLPGIYKDWGVHMRNILHHDITVLTSCCKCSRNASFYGQHLPGCIKCHPRHPWMGAHVWGGTFDWWHTRFCRESGPCCDYALFYRTQVSLGSDLWVRFSVTNWVSNLVQT